MTGIQQVAGIHAMSRCLRPTMDAASARAQGRAHLQPSREFGMPPRQRCWACATILGASVIAGGCPGFIGVDNGPAAANLNPELVIQAADEIACPGRPRPPGRGVG